MMRPAPPQTLLFLRTYDYAWFYASPRREIVPSAHDDPTHFVYKVHVTRGLVGPIAPLCEQFSVSDYHARRLFTPVMDDRNVCVRCRDLLDRQSDHLLARATTVLLVRGHVEQRGEIPQQAFQEALTSVAQFQATITHLDERVRAVLSDAMAQQQEALHALYMRLEPLGLPAPLAPSPSPSLPQHQNEHREDNIVQIFGNDEEFNRWKRNHKDDGFIANEDANKRKRFRVHRANCGHMRGEWEEEGRSWTESRKVCTTNLLLLVQTLQETLEADEKDIAFCKVCLKDIAERQASQS